MKTSQFKSNMNQLGSKIKGYGTSTFQMSRKITKAAKPTGAACHKPPAPNQTVSTQIQLVSTLPDPRNPENVSF